jgi:hypothetical protein
MHWSIIIFLLVLVIIGWLVLKYTSLGKHVPDSIKPYLLIPTEKKEEKYSDATLNRSRLPTSMRFNAAVRRALGSTLHLFNKYVSGLSENDKKNFVDNVKNVINEYSGDPSVDGANVIINAIKEFGLPIVEKLSGADVAASFASDVETKVRSVINNVINFSLESNPLSISNIMKGPMMNKVMDFHFNRDGTNVEARNVHPYIKKGPKNDINAPAKNPILAMIHNEFPAIRSSQSLLPTGTEPMNLEIANLIAANRRYYRKPESIVMDRGADPRPLPKPLVDIVVRTNGKNPNSIERSTHFNAIDILESSRGEAGNEYINDTLEKLYKESDMPFIQDFDDIVRAELQKSAGYGNLLNRGQTDLIISELKMGN